MKSVNSIRFKNKSDIKKFYDEHGWVLISNGIKKEIIKHIRNDLNLISKSLFKKSFENCLQFLNKNNKKKLFEFHKLINKLISNHYINFQINDIFKIINNNQKPSFNLGSTFLLGLIKDKRLVYDFHQESSYIKNIKDVTSIHFPVFRKTNYVNGTMSVLDKSHKIKNLPFKKIIKKNSYTDLIPQNMDNIQKKYEEVFLNINIGDILFFHKDLIHKSNYNNSNKPRVCYVGRFKNFKF